MLQTRHFQTIQFVLHVIGNQTPLISLSLNPLVKLWQLLAVYPYPIELPIPTYLGFDTHHTQTPRWKYQK